MGHIAHACKHYIRKVQRFTSRVVDPLKIQLAMQAIDSGLTLTYTEDITSEKI